MTRMLIVATAFVASLSVGAAPSNAANVAVRGVVDAHTDPVASLDVNSEKCIRDNAPKVEQAIPDIGEAVDFLVSKLCANEVAAENAVEAKRQQSQTAEQWQKMCDEQKNAKKESVVGTDQNGHNDVDYCSLGKVGFLVEPSDTGYTLYSPGTEPAAAIALAAHLLLDLRLSHGSAAERH